MSEKILSVDADDGIVYADQKTFDELIEKLRKSMTKSSDPLAVLREKSKLAKISERSGNWSKAVDLNYDILRYGGIVEYRKNPKSELGKLALEAYNAIWRMHSSEDEYVWEICSQIIGDVGEYFE